MDNNDKLSKNPVPHTNMKPNLSLFQTFAVALFDDIQNEEQVDTKILNEETESTEFFEAKWSVWSAHGAWDVWSAHGRWGVWSDHGNHGNHGNHSNWDDWNDWADHSDTISDDSTMYVDIDTESPGGSVQINNGASHALTEEVTLNLFTTDDDVEEMMISNYSDFRNSTGWIPYSSSKSWTLPGGSGNKTVYVKFRDESRNESTRLEDSIFKDSVLPSSPTVNFTSPSGYSGDWISKDVTFTITDGTDSESGVAKSQYSLDDGCTWIDYTGPVTVSNEGTFKVLARTIDNAGNRSIVNALKFDGSNDYVDLDENKFTSNSPLHSSNTDVTFSAWIKPENLSSDSTNHGVRNVIFANSSDSANDNFEIGVYNDVIDVYIDEEGNDSTDHVNTEIKEDTWYFITVTKSSTDGLKVYKNGQLVYTNSSRTDNFDGTSGDYSIGRSDHVDTYFNGYISEVSLWDRGINESEVQDIMTKGIDTSESGLYNYWPFYEGEGSVAKDYASNNDGAIYGATYQKTNIPTIKIDKSNPTAPTINFTSPSGYSGDWTNEDVTFTINDGTDAISGIAKSQYSLDNGKTWIDYTGPVTVSDEGIYKVLARSVDNSGNKSIVNGLDFDGYNDYVALDMYMNDTLPQFTAFGWINTTEGNWSILDFDRSEYFTFTAGGNATDSGKVGFHTTSLSNGIHDMSGNKDILDGQEHFVAVVYDGRDKIIYVDGEEDARVSNAHNGADVGDRNVTRYGFIGDGSEASTFNGNRNDIYYKGKIRQVGFFETALTQQQLKEIMNSKTISETLPTPKAYWKMNEGGGTTLKDETGNHPGTIFGVTYEKQNEYPLIKIDKSAATGSVLIESDPRIPYDATTSYEVDLQIEAEDNESDVTDMQISNYPDFRDSTGWIDYDSTYEDWELRKPEDYSGDEDFTKHVYIRFRDQAGNISEPATDQIEFEVIPKINSTSMSPGIYLGKGTNLEAGVEDVVEAKYRIYYTNSPTEPSVNTTSATPGTEWKDSGITGDFNNITSTQISQHISRDVFDNTDWTYVTFKVYVESRTEYGVHTYTQAHSLNAPNDIVGYIGHNQKIRIYESGRELVVSSPDSPVMQYDPNSSDIVKLSSNNTFENAAPVKYRAEFDVQRPDQIASMNVYFDFNLYNKEGVEFVPEEVVLQRYIDNNNIENIATYTGNSIKEEITDSRNRCYVSIDESKIKDSIERYFVEYRGSLNIEPDHDGGTEEIFNEVEVELTTPDNNYGDPVNEKAPNRKRVIKTKITRDRIQYE